MENATAGSNFSECFSGDSPHRRRVFLFYYLAVMIISIPVNIFSLHVSWQHIRQKNELGVYLFNLALSDLTFTAGLSLWLDYLWRGVWIYGGNVCMLSINSLYTNFYTSEVFLCCIAVNRYLAVVHPLKYKSLRKVSTAMVVSISLWVLVIGFNATTITKEDSYYESKTISLCFDIFIPQSVKLCHISVVRFFLGFTIPIIIVLYTTWRTRVAIKSNRATKEEERMHISKLLTVVLVSILLCFGPIHVIMLIRILLTDCTTLNWLLYIYKISTAITTLNTLLDPLLYCFITRTGKASVKEVIVFFLGKKKNRSESSEE